MDSVIREALMKGLHQYHARRDRAALEDLLPLARLGIPEAQYRVAKIYLRGCTSTSTHAILYPRAIKWFEFAADRSHPLADFELRVSDGAPKEYRFAAEWDKGALPHNHNEMSYFESQRAYAVFLSGRHGDPQDTTSPELQLALERAATGGVVEAMRDLGALYWTHRDRQNAVRWMERASAECSIQAQYILGLWHATDVSIRDERKAKYWYGVAADFGSVEALFNLGQMLLDVPGSAVESSTVENAVEYVTLAATSESQEAQMYLARCYKEGAQGVEKDSALSDFWRAKAERWAFRAEHRSSAFAAFAAAMDCAQMPG